MNYKNLIKISIAIGIIIGFILVFIYLTNNNNLSNPNKIAVIGNGPLSDENINEINSNFNIIAIMNVGANGDKKNKLNATDLYTRQWGVNSNLNVIGLNGFDDKNKIYNSYEKYSDTLKNIIIIAPKDEEYKDAVEYIKKNYKNVELYSIDPHLHIKRNKGPNKLKFDNKEHDIYHNSLSAGILTLRHVLDKYPKHIIHTYGMNFNFNEISSKSHDGVAEKKIIDDCDRCIVHKTWKDTYDPFIVS